VTSSRLSIVAMGRKPRFLIVGDFLLVSFPWSSMRESLQTWLGLQELSDFQRQLKKRVSLAARKLNPVPLRL
ncbi:MAG TPA: hypothetical protein VN920_04940, partial [Pyrinomonadaceae bacterium]|nr:hypothetical protein [Pyrinomonadaceae bacterium]